MAITTERCRVCGRLERAGLDQPLRRGSLPPGVDNDNVRSSLAARNPHIPHRFDVYNLAARVSEVNYNEDGVLCLRCCFVKLELLFVSVDDLAARSLHFDKNTRGVSVRELQVEWTSNQMRHWTDVHNVSFAERIRDSKVD